jgi:5-methyltetrahydrofolate--homocysteine methyltransferase
MSNNVFIGVGENIHCTRIFKVGGLRVKTDDEQSYYITFMNGESDDRLPIPSHFKERSDWEAGKVKHCAVAFWQALHGEGEGQQKGIEYLKNLAVQQEKAGATYLDINVDEYSTDVPERVALMKWAVENTQKASSLPVSIDSSNIDILRAGLEACDRGRAKPMLNSVSLERKDAVEVAAEQQAVVIASAAGEKGLPSAPDERMANIDAIIGMLHDKGFSNSDIHVDPLVFPISTDGNNGNTFLETVSKVREKYGADIHIVAGLSNVSFGMPNRKLINQVFSWLAVKAGADGGIVDPLQINGTILAGMDSASEEFKLAEDLLTGKDDFGMNFITAFRK